MVRQKIIEMRNRTCTVRSRRGNTYDCIILTGLKTEKLSPGDWAYIEFKAGTPIMTGFEEKRTISPEELKKQEENLKNLGGDY